MKTNEIFYAIFGRVIGRFMFGHIDHFDEGEPCSVKFNYDKVMASVDKGKNLIGFYHTHPNMPAYMSGTDIRTMGAWADAEGKELLCLIEGTNGLLTWWCRSRTDTELMMDKARGKVQFLTFCRENWKYKKIGNYVVGIRL